jgi:hypothetical protein
VTGSESTTFAVSDNAMSETSDPDAINQDARIELGGVHIVRILEPDGTMSLEISTDDEVDPWTAIGMIRVALQWELDAYPFPEITDDDF